MKTKLLSIAVLFVATVFCSCSHDDNDPVITPVAPAAANGFTWKENGGSTIKTAASATFTTQYKTLIAKDASNNTLFEINLSGTGAATYTIDANNHLTYATTTYFTADAGSVVITSNAGGKVSGTFHTTGPAAAGVTAVDGTFTNITVVP